MAGIEEECLVCQQRLAGEEVQWLPCAHPFHKYCLDEYMRVKGISDVALLPCPTCRSVGSAGESQFQELLNGPDENVDGTSDGSVDCLVVSSNSAAVVRSLSSIIKIGQRRCFTYCSNTIIEHCTLRHNQ